jgi:hypothetical protein
MRRIVVYFLCFVPNLSAMPSLPISLLGVVQKYIVHF